MSYLFHRLRQRKLVQWALGYLGTAWLVLEMSDVVGDKFGLPESFYRELIFFLLFGFLVVLVLAWFHGEKGRQRVSGTELAMLATLGVAGGLTFRTQPWAGVDEEGTGVTREASSGGSGVVPLRAVLYDNPSVALLPLRNLGAEEDGPFVEGLHDDILSALQKIGGLTVISNTSVQRYRNGEFLLPEIARELRVDAVGEGTVSRGGDRVRVNIQLIDGETDTHLWSEQFDRELTASHVFAIRTEIARAVARAMRARLTAEEEVRVQAWPTSNLTAFDWVQIARSRCAGCAERAEAYRRALEIDPAYAVAWAGLASNYAVRVIAFGAPTILADSALTFADRALDLQPELAAAYGAKANVWYARWGQTARALDHARRAAELEQGVSGWWTNVGVYSAMRGSFQEALEAYWRSVRFHPRSAMVRGNMAELYAALGLFERAEEVLAEAAEIDPEDETVLHYRSYTRALQGDLPAAYEMAERTARLHPLARNYQWAALLAQRANDVEAALRHAEAARALAREGLSMEANVRSVPVTLGFALHRAGRTAEAGILFAEARTRLQERIDGGADDGYIRVEMAAIAAARGDAREAARWLEAALEAGYRYEREIALDRIFDAVRGAPAFERVQRRMRSEVDEMRARVLEREEELKPDSGEARSP